MSIETSNRLTVRLFLGISLSSEIRMYLNQNMEWKQRLMGEVSQEDLREVHFQGKDYLGFYLQNEKITLNELKRIEELAKQQIKRYCSELEMQSLHVFIFPQLFIA